MVVSAPRDTREWLIAMLLTKGRCVEDAMPEAPPLMFQYQCFQCEAPFTAVVYRQSGELSLAVLPGVRGGLRTAHTPDGVAFYLDQAQQARSVGANSAAVAMYRGALEHLLFEQGFRKGMLAIKIAELQKKIDAGDAPEWATYLNTRFLVVLKDLGNGAIHPNDGNVAKQATFDRECFNDISVAFLELLNLVYEREHETNERLGRLGKKAERLDKRET